MSTKADLKRTRMALQQERLNLKELALELARQRRQLTRERELVLVVLRAACERYGSTNWSEHERLDTILQDHLIEPLDRVTQRVSRQMSELDRRLTESEAARRVLVAQARAAPPAVQAAPPAPPPPPSPRPLRPTVVPPIEHRCVVVRAQLRDESGYRATCICGYRTSCERTEAMATLEGERHVERLTTTSGEVRRDTR